MNIKNAKSGISAGGDEKMVDERFKIAQFAERQLMWMPPSRCALLIILFDPADRASAVRGYRAAKA